MTTKTPANSTDFDPISKNNWTWNNKKNEFKLQTYTWKKNDEKKHKKKTKSTKSVENLKNKINWINVHNKHYFQYRLLRELSQKKAEKKSKFKAAENEGTKKKWRGHSTHCSTSSFDRLQVGEFLCSLLHYPTFCYTKHRFTLRFYSFGILCVFYCNTWMYLRRVENVTEFLILQFFHWWFLVCWFVSGIWRWDYLRIMRIS